MKIQPTRLTIISGGQTGIDRQALDVAIESGIPHGGWCPLGRLAEDGPIPDRYRLQETASANYSERTRLNILHSDGTLVLHGGQPEGGTALTIKLAKKLAKPLLAIDFFGTPHLNHDWVVQQALDWIENHSIFILNIAGPRLSSSPHLTTIVRPFLENLVAAVRV